MKIFIWVALALALFLTACGGRTEEPAPSIPLSDNNDAEKSMVSTGRSYATMVDEQGTVSVTVTPVELSETVSALRFEVALNTHSVELDMDLAELATLSTDNGQVVPASLWDAETGGHHVSGILSFPANVAGIGTLADASAVTLTIRNVDAAERVFTWKLIN